jgi:hypothetical protein
MKTFLIALALIFAVICGAVVVSGLTGTLCGYRHRLRQRRHRFRDQPEVPRLGAISVT